ncbi:MAG TPA: hypothetical protein VN541_17805 [Tepidisphaeraceae bacterium]|nr:hypothetical protein [Tepidisphaeraceae bacterium]
MIRIPAWIAMISWAIFCLSAALEYGYDVTNHIPLPQVVLVCLAVTPLILARVLADRRQKWQPWLRTLLDAHTNAVDSLPVAYNGLWIALAAGLGLYAELALIRFHGSCFQLFAFFKNLSLLSCFLGLGIGYMLGNRKPLATPLVIIGLAIEMGFMHALRFTAIGHTLHNPVSEQVALGLDAAIDWNHVLTSYAMLICTFSFNALCFIPLGHLASYLMGRTSRLAGYSWNLLGSLGGIVLFNVLSFAWTPPAVWTAAAIVLLIPFLLGNRVILGTTAVVSALLLGLLSMSFNPTQYDIYSPYQILTVEQSKDPHPLLSVNHVYFQRILDLSPSAVKADPANLPAEHYYGLPYAVKPHPDDVCIVGAGTGNDVASAVRHGAGHVDAVEIDPAIQYLGRKLHPESPYQSPTVTPHIQDARAFIRWTDKKFDLIVYGLLDSHTLVSSLSGVRLDSYIYTTDAFREARAHLKKGGMICLTFCMIRGELGRKLYLMLKDAFDGREPVIYQTDYDGGYSFIIGDDMPASAKNVHIPGIKLATDVFAGNTYHADPSTDNWPFFYMPVRKYPLTYAAMIALVLIVATLFIVPFARASGEAAGFSVPCFLLGAGFMLLETKAITELALYYGSTWVVTGIVITAILIMAFLANLLLIGLGSFPRTIAYILLLLSLGGSLVLTYLPVSSWGMWEGRVFATAVLTLPLFFSGLVFSSELKRARSVGVALGSNLLGAMLGGCLEYNSMYFGYRSLYVVALIIYALALVSSLRRTPTSEDIVEEQRKPERRKSSHLQPAR